MARGITRATRNLPVNMTDNVMDNMMDNTAVHLTTRRFMPAFTTQKLVRFQHCDPAGIIFFPQYFLLFNEIVEDWFTQDLGVDWRKFHIDDKLGFPVKKTTTEFFSPSVIGEVLDCSLEVRRLGRSSVELLIRITCKGDLRAVVEETRIHTSLLVHRSRPLDPGLRAHMERYLVPPATIALAQ
jgi:4-hydroxybenzoyl-CoA thioesterase